MTDQAGRKQRHPGQFQPGTSGNPAGRPKGSGKVQELRAAIAEHVPEIVGKLVEQAKEGDTGAARLLLERVIPPVKAEELPSVLALPEGALADQGRAILSAAAGGVLPATQAARLLGALGAVAKLIETDELAARVAALEKRNEQRP